jgi:hypothetical protein
MVQHRLQQQGQQKQQLDNSKKRLSTSVHTTAIHPPKRRKVSDESNTTRNSQLIQPNTKLNCNFYDHPLSRVYFDNKKRGIVMTNPDPPSSSSHIRQEEIDQLRNRVDSVLKNLVQSTEVDTQVLKTQVQSLRDGPGSVTGGAVFISSEVSSRSSGNGEDETDKNTNATSTTTKYVEQQWIVDPYGDQGEFEGELNADNLPHGTGIMKYTDGRVYAGEWKAGRWHGKGRATFSNGDVFEGMYYEDQRHGLGIYQWCDGREFKGGFVNDQRSGHGEYTWPDGAKYSGEFQKGLRHGEGTYTVRKRNKLPKNPGMTSSHWADSNDLPVHCFWMTQFSDGSFYKGSWKQGKYHGKGEVCRDVGLACV